MSTPKQQVSVIIPTYGEAENLPHLVPQVAQVLDEAGLSVEIIVVDDNSPDDTPGVCERLAQEYPLRLLVRKNERGLSSAVIHGMNHAEGEALVVMDADLSHPPDKVPELIDALQQPDTDFVIGSRYIQGGSTDEAWGFLRWLNSRVATLLARPFTNARDPMAGFFALRRETFQEAEELNPIGYKIGLELIVKCGCRHVREIPIRFKDRQYGQSKLTIKEQLRYLLHLARLLDFKFEHLTCPVKFCLVGASGMVVDLLLFSLLLTTTPLMAARALAIWVAMSWNFMLNRHFTFREDRRHHLLGQYALFCASCLVGAFVNWGTSVSLAYLTGFFHHYPVAAAAVGVIAGTGFNYFFSRHITFRQKAA